MSTPLRHDERENCDVRPLQDDDLSAALGGVVGHVAPTVRTYGPIDND